MGDVFPERLRKLRKGRSSVAVSELCKMNKDAIRRYEKGEAEPKLSTLIAIANEYNVSLDYLAGLSDDPKRYNNPS